jgi:hypothetical protein
MKAEHRKELQTNSLADMLGRTVRNVRGGTGVSWTWIIVFAVLAVAVVIFFWVRNNQARNNSELWVKVDDNTPKTLQQIYNDSKDSNQGKAAMLTLVHEELYSGVKSLGGGPQFQSQGVEYLTRCQAIYGMLEKDCEGNDEWVAEAKYGQAVATEALAVVDPENLKKAKDQFEQLAKGDLGKTGFGMLAARRLEQLSNATDQAAIAAFYRDFRTNSLFQMKGK